MSFVSCCYAIFRAYKLLIVIFVTCVIVWMRFGGCYKVSESSSIFKRTQVQPSYLGSATKFACISSHFWQPNKPLNVGFQVCTKTLGRKTFHKKFIVKHFSIFFIHVFLCAFKGFMGVVLKVVKCMFNLLFQCTYVGSNLDSHKGQQ